MTKKFIPAGKPPQGKPAAPTKPEAKPGEVKRTPAQILYPDHKSEAAK